jgi:lysophospholipase L1-like esterase
VAFFLGDSIVMGHGVTAGETFANRLESTLERFGRGYDSYQIINAGVQGYSTSQELALLREEIRFAPDFIAIGFCLNDVTVPFVLPDGQSVTAPNMDLVRVAGSATGPWFLRFLLNETGYGQCIQKLRQWLYAQQSGPDPWHEDLKEVARSRREDPRVSAGWDLVLKDLESVYRLAAQAEIPVTLIIFPTVSQLFTPQAKEPQRILGRHAQAHGVTAIDMATELESWLERRMETAISAVYSSAILPAVLREVVNLLAFEYFIDGMHLTPKGHRVTAAALLRHLDAKGLVDIADEAQVILRSELDPYLKEDGYLGNFSLALDNVASIAHTGKAFALMGNIAGAEMFYSLGLQTFKNLDSQKFLYRQLVELYSAAGRHTDARQIQKKLAALAPDMP